MKYLLLSNRHESIYGGDWCLFHGSNDSPSGYESDVRKAHRFEFTEEQIEIHKKHNNIPIPIDILGLPERWEKNYNPNVRMLVEKGTLNRLMRLNLRPLFEDED